MNSGRETMAQSTELPRFLTVPEAAQILGIGRTLAYELIRTNAWPTPVVRLGKLIKIPTGPLLDLIVGN
jgi:excisionase family DNA binding protein